MTKTLVRTEEILKGEGIENNYTLEYYLLENQHSFKTGNINYMCYGVEITINDESNHSECCSTEEIFSSKELAIKFINEIADGLVTPCTLGEVVSNRLIESLN